NMWEQLELTYDFGVDRLWILNVGDLKPMEYPITLFLDMAWNPKAFTGENLLSHTLRFFEQQVGADQAPEAARIFNLLCKYNGRITPEMLDSHTYNLITGEWKAVADDYARLEAEALRQYISLDPAYQDTYRELILFPVQLMANLYQMYYAQAMNRELSSRNLTEANHWADVAERCFERDGMLMKQYNEEIAGGKWNGMMIQKHIGYTIWNDNFPEDYLIEKPKRIEGSLLSGGHSFESGNGVVVMEAPHFNKAVNPPADAKWEVWPFIGRTEGGVAVMPYTVSPEGAALEYEFLLPEEVDSVTVHVITKSTLAFQRPEGHRYNVSLDGGQPVTINFNGNLNEHPDNIYSVFYPTVAGRVVEKKTGLPVKDGSTVTELTATGKRERRHILTLAPLDPGIVFEKIVVDFGGYEPEYLFGNETPLRRNL
ncbi:MAG: glycosyl hydrolase 115 family protein, partial [Muribaculaceae bacterium]|nr:glycosyl hydrolase 115 family protein [Muribaculaceae bacterium]